MDDEQFGQRLRAIFSEEAREHLAQLDRFPERPGDRV